MPKVESWNFRRYFELRCKSLQSFSCSFSAPKHKNILKESLKTLELENFCTAQPLALYFIYFLFCFAHGVLLSNLFVHRDTRATKIPITRPIHSWIMTKNQIMEKLNGMSRAHQKSHSSVLWSMFAFLFHVRILQNIS